MSLYDFADLPAPDVDLTQPVFHPTQPQTVIGHTGVDLGREEAVATFPRNREGADGQKHYFEKYKGYAISERVLETLAGRGVNTILLVERDGDQRIIEYDHATFLGGHPVAYSPEEDTIIEGDLAIEHADHDVFSDRQRVAPTSEARAFWDRTDVTLKRP